MYGIWSVSYTHLKCPAVWKQCYIFLSFPTNIVRISNSSITKVFILWCNEYYFLLFPVLLPPATEVTWAPRYWSHGYVRPDIKVGVTCRSYVNVRAKHAEVRFRLALKLHNTCSPPLCVGRAQSCHALTACSRFTRLTLEIECDSCMRQPTATASNLVNFTA